MTPSVPDDPDEPVAPTGGEEAWRSPGGFPWPPLVIIGVAVLVSAIVIGWRVTRPAPAGPRVITDQAFVEQANQRCAAVIPGLRPQDTRRDDISSPAQIAEQSTRAAEGLAILSQELRALPVAAEQKPFVEGWLDGWGTFIDSGRRYARTIESGDVEAANDVARSGDPAQRRADAFARGNGIDACLLQSAIRKPRGSGL